MIALPDGRILGTGRSDHVQNAVCHAITAAGLAIVPLSEWVVSWPASPQLRKDLKEATLYVTLEPSHDRQGTPSLTQLIAQCGLTRVVIGCADPIPEKATEGAAALHKAGLEVILGFEEEECQELIEEYATLANSKLQRSARQHFARSGQVRTVTFFVFWLFYHDVLPNNTRHLYFSLVSINTPSLLASYTVLS